MQNTFSQKLKELREKKFPGRSLRLVGEFFEHLDFGSYFYTQLSKMENGTLLPSPSLLMKILTEGYGASEEERREIFMEYSMATTMTNLNKMEKLSQNKGLALETTTKLYRRKPKKN